MSGWCVRVSGDVPIPNPFANVFVGEDVEGGSVESPSSSTDLISSPCSCGVPVPSY